MSAACFAGAGASATRAPITINTAPAPTTAARSGSWALDILRVMLNREA